MCVTSLPQRRPPGTDHPFNFPLTDEPLSGLHVKVLPSCCFIAVNEKGPSKLNCSPEAGLRFQLCLRGAVLFRVQFRVANSWGTRRHKLPIPEIAAFPLQRCGFRLIPAPASTTLCCAAGERDLLPKHGLHRATVGFVPRQAALRRWRSCHRHDQLGLDPPKEPPLDAGMFMHA